MVFTIDKEQTDIFIGFFFNSCICGSIWRTKTEIIDCCCQFFMIWMIGKWNYKDIIFCKYWALIPLIKKAFGNSCDTEVQLNQLVYIHCYHYIVLTPPTFHRWIFHEHHNEGPPTDCGGGKTEQHSSLHPCR